MSYALTYSRAYVGVEAPLVRVETHLSGGLPALTIVGLINPHDFTKPEPNENN
jgi:magnesium chelatase family protein|tara:strand:+ start:7068 stop:7226 length:159 start_codon:yes stop_codon:yes gene_type:complete